PQESIARADVDDSIDDRSASANAAAGVELPEDLTVRGIVCSDKSALRACPYQSVCASPGDGNRPKISLVVRARRLPQDVTRSSVERADRTLLGMIGDSDVDAFSVRRAAKLDAAQLSSRTDFFFPFDRAGRRVEGKEPTALLARANQRLVSLPLEEDRGHSKIDIQIAAFCKVAAVEGPNVPRGCLIRPHQFAGVEVQG